MKRFGFITNSSSTSFIAFGIPLDSPYPIEEDEYVTDKYGDNMSWEDFYCEKTGKGWGDGAVEFWGACHTEDAVMCVTKSRQDVEYGYAKVEVDTTEAREWTNIIAEACKELGIPYSEPHWFLWHTGMDG